MALTVDLVTIDCADPSALADFWTKALGYAVAYDDGSYLLLAPPGGAEGTPGVRLGLQRVPEPTPGKNRVHLDLRATDRAAEVEWLVGIGAAVIDEQVTSGFSWTVLADPAGTMFCVGSEN